jgi:hypothetical protein
VMPGRDFLTVTLYNVMFPDTSLLKEYPGIKPKWE